MVTLVKAKPDYGQTARWSYDPNFPAEATNKLRLVSLHGKNEHILSLKDHWSEFSLYHLNNRLPTIKQPMK